MHEAEAVELLRQRFTNAEGWAVLGQVPDGTGGLQRRTADAIMMQLWPSRGLHIYGIEYKQHRGDWRRELRDPAKAESVASYCHFWIVLAPKGVVPAEELPDKWGLWELDKADRIHKTVPAILNQKPEPIDYAFLAGIFRASANYKENTLALRAAEELGYKRAAKAHELTHKDDNKRLKDEQQRVKDFEERSGISIETWYGAAKLGEEVRKCLKMLTEPDSYRYQINNLEEAAEEILKGVKQLKIVMGAADGKDEGSRL